MIVLDANILIRPVLGFANSLRPYAAEGFRFIAPDVAFNDAQKYLPPRLKKRGRPDGDVLALLEYLRQIIEPIDRELYGEFETEAR